ncbi:type II toxin-antitoxin system RelE/ParE family toxin [Halocynthiibacter styelae]|uniref:Toxin n=1 Tax=Halocynthiibacter styelae TaxID=2761955 RepID=A0A8J7IT35_9RHOB|nr:type II toxin-antitoxin system RelE/ParE family toxin [Paenihalocynthiibacter styelae]MBI1495111.1 type II toxin-antitoxin system RelE/ParE family toxin [Paenihalocynthiibacter styelae]
MPDLQITLLARSDLMDIGRYTQETWGVAQRNSYLGALAHLFEQIASGEVAGRARSEIREGLFSTRCNRHIVFYRTGANAQIEVLRVLHERMDFARHF